MRKNEKIAVTFKKLTGIKPNKAKRDEDGFTFIPTEVKNRKDALSLRLKLSGLLGPGAIKYRYDGLLAKLP